MAAKKRIGIVLFQLGGPDSLQAVDIRLSPADVRWLEEGEGGVVEAASRSMPQ